MLSIIYGDVKNSIYNTNVYFKNSYEPEWLEVELAKKMIKDIDDSEVLSGECINSPVLRSLSTRRKLRKNMVKQQIQGYLFNKSTKYGERRCA